MNPILRYSQSQLVKAYLGPLDKSMETRFTGLEITTKPDVIFATAKVKKIAKLAYDYLCMHYNAVPKANIEVLRKSVNQDLENLDKEGIGFIVLAAKYSNYENLVFSGTQRV